jgi:hypothetical protein
MKNKLSLLKTFNSMINKTVKFNFCLIDKFVSKNKAAITNNESSFQSSFSKNLKVEPLKESLSVEEITEKYICDHLKFNNLTLNNDNYDKIKSFVKNLAKEEIFQSENVKNAQILNKLKLFIENCVRYNKCNYLDSEYFFKNKNYNFLLDSSILEKEYQAKNPYKSINVVQENLKISSEYENILKSYKSMESIPQEIIDKNKDIFLNFLNFMTSSVEFNRESIINQKLEKNLDLIKSAKNEKILISNDTDNLQIPENYKKILAFKQLLTEQDVFKQHFAEGKIQEVIDKLIIGDSIYLKNYPGSIKGKNPEDDPEHFFNWFEKNHPKEVVESFNRIVSRLEEENLKNVKGIESGNFKQGEEDNVDDENKEIDNDEINVREDEFQENDDKNEKYNKNDNFARSRSEFLQFKSEYNKPNKNYEKITNSHHFENDGLDDITGATIQEEDVEDELDDDTSNIFTSGLDNHLPISLMPPKIPFMFMNFFKAMCDWNEAIQEFIDKDSYLSQILGDSNINSELVAETKYYNEGIKYKYSMSMKSLVQIYPDSVKNNINVRNIIQALDKYCNRNYTLDTKQFILDVMAYTVLPFSKKSNQFIEEYLIEGSRTPPRTMKNFKKYNAINWKKVERRVIKEKIPDDIESETTDEELRIVVGGFVDTGIDAELEELERQEEKKKAEKEKRDAENAKNMGKEAFDAYKKKIEDEKKAKEKEEEEREEKEIEKENLQAQKEEDGTFELAETADHEIEEENVDVEEDSDEVLDDMGRVVFGHNELDRNWTITPDDYVGKELKKKFLVSGGLPKLEKNRWITNPDQIRFTELYEKMQKLKISKDEEEEFLKYLEFRISDPERFSQISGIPISEITFSTEKAKNIAENLFKDVSKVNLSENELRIMYGDNISMDSNDINNEIDPKKLEESAGSFYIKPLENPYIPSNPNLNPIPIDFYDNDDGFWDSFKQNKLNKLDFSSLNNAPFFSLKDNLVKRKSDENVPRV